MTESEPTQTRAAILADPHASSPDDDEVVQLGLAYRGSRSFPDPAPLHMPEQDLTCPWSGPRGPVRMGIVTGVILVTAVLGAFVAPALAVWP